MASCYLSSIILKVAAVFLFIAFVLHVVGLATPNWTTLDTGTNVLDGSVDSGLWQACTRIENLDTVCLNIVSSDNADWFKATQALVIIGLVALFASLVITFVLLCTKQRRSLKLLNIILLTIAGLCILIAVVIYGVETDELMDVSSNLKLDYSFILCVVAASLILLVCLPLLIWDICMTRRRQYRDDRIRYTSRKREVYVQPEERYASPPPMYEYPKYEYPKYEHYEPSYEPVRYSRQEYVAPYTIRPEYTTYSRPAYTEYRSSKPAYVDYRSSRPDYSDSMRYSYRR